MRRKIRSEKTSCEASGNESLNRTVWLDMNTHIRARVENGLYILQLTEPHGYARIIKVMPVPGSNWRKNVSGGTYLNGMRRRRFPVHVCYATLREALEKIGGHRS